MIGILGIFREERDSCTTKVEYTENQRSRYPEITDPNKLLGAYTT